MHDVYVCEHLLEEHIALHIRYYKIIVTKELYLHDIQQRVLVRAPVKSSSSFWVGRSTRLDSAHNVQEGQAGFWRHTRPHMNQKGLSVPLCRKPVPAGRSSKKPFASAIGIRLKISNHTATWCIHEGVTQPAEVACPSSPVLGFPMSPCSLNSATPVTTTRPSTTSSQDFLFWSM